MAWTRDREDADLGACVAGLRAVYETSGYPTNWPADPARWLSPTGILRAWVATAEDIPIAGHVLLMRPSPGERSAAGGAAEVSRLFVVPVARRQGVGAALLDAVMGAADANGLDLFLDVTDHLGDARALYQRGGVRLVESRRAEWTTPDGGPVTLHRYAWSRTPLRAVQRVAGAEAGFGGGGGVEVVEAEEGGAGDRGRVDDADHGGGGAFG